MKLRNKGFVVLALAAFMLSSCLKDDPDVGTIILMGTESYVDSIEEVIPDTLLKVLKDKTIMQLDQAVLPKGNTPPDVQGEFVLCPKELIWYNGYSIAAGDSICLRFGGDASASGYYPNGQHNRVVPLDYKEDAMAKLHADKAYLMGSGSSFTAYFELTHQHIDEIPGVDFDLTRGYVITGKMSPKGDSMLNVRIAYINLELKVNYNNVAVSGVPNNYIEALKGYIFVYRAQNDGPVLRQQWYKD